MDETILVTRDEPIATVILNRPERLNAQDAHMLAELDGAFKELEQDDTVRVIVLTGAGPSFSSGHDLRFPAWEPSNLDVEKRYKMEQRTFVDGALALRNIAKPTIAKVRGYCLGGGVMVAAMCDIIIASDNASFGNPVIRMAAAGLELLVEPWDVGVRRAKELLFTGRHFDAAEAARIGLVNHVVADDSLDEVVAELAREIAAQPPFALAMLKRSLNQTLDAMGQRTAFEQHFMTHLLVHNSTENHDFFAEVARRGGGVDAEGFQVMKRVMDGRGEE
jgi:enoyl-CoA hydratase